MYVIVGLGNPGKKYENTRHNVGFKVIDELADKYAISVIKLKFKALIGEGKIAGEKVILVKPQTFMNLSGDSVREIVNFYKIPMENLIIAYDDIDISLGTIRIRKSGSGGTHNGMKSVVTQVGSRDFPRVRVGLGNNEKSGLVNYVIGKVPKAEKKILEDAVKDASKAIEDIIDKGIDNAMNINNVKKGKNED